MASSHLPKLIDTHCHIQTAEFAADIEDVLCRANAEGVKVLIVVGGAGDLSTNDDAVTLAEKHPNLYATVGMHPHDAKDVTEAGMARLKTLTKHPRVVAVGETGLDFYYDHSPRQVQINMFGRFIDLALETKSPIVVHNRDSDREVADMLRVQARGELRGVIHCFTGDHDAAREFLDLGFFLSFSGILTFKSAATLREVAQWVPLDRILVETDSPYLAPVPKRGRRNEPAYVRFVAETLALVKGLPVEDIARATCRNAAALFGIECVTD